MTKDPPPILRPKPHRINYDLTPTSTNSSAPSSPSRRPSDSFKSDIDRGDDFAEKATRTRSILNLTSSTLFGIYTPTASSFDANRSEPSTPFGLGTQTPRDDSKPPVIGPYVTLPSHANTARSNPYSTGSWGKVVSLGERATLLFLFGMAYGLIVTHLRDNQQVVPVRYDLRGIEHHSWGYLLGWGGIGVVIGALLPWVDILWEEVLGNSKDVFPSNSHWGTLASPSQRSENLRRQSPGSGSGLGADWNPVVRSIGAFIGIAFAIRRLPWQSTSQISLTLALVNPVLWYLVDRSKPGFLLSMLVSLAGTCIAFGVNPEIVPPPAAPSMPAGSMANIAREYGVHDGLIRNESIGVGTWIASVLFCSSVCFGNIGRRLALGTEEMRSNVS